MPKYCRRVMPYLKKLVCCLLHHKYHEMGVSQVVDAAAGIQFWRCQWWCKRCGRQWQVVAEMRTLTGTDWGFPTHVTREYTSDGTFTGE